MSVLASLNILLGMDVAQVTAGAKHVGGAMRDMDARAGAVWSGQREQLEAYERKLQSVADLAARSKITPEEQAGRARMEGIKLGNDGGGEALATYRDKMETLSAQLSSGAISQQTFAVSAAEARGEVMRASEAAERGAGHQVHYQHTLRRLDAELHTGQISFAEYSHRIDEAREHMERAEHAAESMHRVIEIGRAALETVGIAVGVEQTFEFLKTSVEAADEAKQSFGRMNALVKATGAAAGYSARGLREMAEKLEEVTNYAHLETEAVEAVLLTDRKISGINFKRAVEAVQNISAVQGDLRSNAIALGKALEDPETGMASLRREGIMLDASQQALVSGFMRAGDVMRAQAVILDEIETEYGGAASGMRSDIKGLENDLDKLKESIGSVAETHAGHAALSATSGYFRNLSRSIEEASRATGGLLNKTKAYWNLMTAAIPGSSHIRADVKLAEEPEPKKKGPAVRDDDADPQALANRDKLIASLREEIHFFGLTGEEREIARLQLQGLTDEELRETETVLHHVQAMRQQAAAEAETKAHAKQLAEEIDSTTDRLREQVETFGTSSEEISVWRLRLHGASEAQTDAANELSKITARQRAYRQELEDTLRVQKDAAEEAARIKEENQTPGEKLKAEIDRLKELRAANLIDQKTFDRAQAKAHKEAAGHDEKHNNEAVLKGSAEAFSAIVKWTGGKSGTVAKQSLDELKKIRVALFGEAKAARAAAASSKKQATSNPRHQAEIDRRRDRVLLRRGARPVDPNTLEPLPPETHGGKHDIALRDRIRRDIIDIRRRQAARIPKNNLDTKEAARNRLRLQAEFRQRHHLAAKQGDDLLLKELEEIRRVLQAQHRTQRNQGQPGVIRKV